MSWSFRENPSRRNGQMRIWELKTNLLWQACKPLSKQDTVKSAVHLVGGSGTEGISDWAEMVVLSLGYQYVRGHLESHWPRLWIKVSIAKSPFLPTWFFSEATPQGAAEMCWESPLCWEMEGKEAEGGEERGQRARARLNTSPCTPGLTVYTDEEATHYWEGCRKKRKKEKKKATVSWDFGEFSPSVQSPSM